MIPLSDLAGQWSAISELLDRALALPAHERVEFVSGLQGDDAQFRKTLLQLLSQSASYETNDFLRTLPRLSGHAAPASIADLSRGDLVGPYRLIQELGAGGMGAVWLAERADGSLKRKVALKLPRLAWGKGLAERMARERDILASLEHAHIGRLYDAGLDQMGRPYLALEYVEGQPIDVYARERSLSVRQKLDLLLQVCAAVAFAHSRLVVHRDLKPSNILVTKDGQVRLLDFGIAKLMEGDSANETQLTQLAGRALTLDYASPEQIKGEPIGTASDVYSLGVVAYELLTGAKPYKLRRGSAAELEEAIAGIDPPLASSVLADPATKKAVRGDIDAILNKALKKSATHRYTTVDAFAQDVRSHLQFKTILARPDSWTYRLRKLVERRKIETAIVAAVILALIGGAYAQVAVLFALAIGTGIALWQRRRALNALSLAEIEKSKAVVALNRADAVNEFMVALLTDVGSSQPLTGPQLLKRSEALLARNPGSSDQRAAVLTTIATLHSSYGDFAEAQRLIDEAVACARQGSEPDLLGHALAYQASFLARGGRVDEGQRALERLVSDYAETPSVMATVMSALSHLAQNANNADGAVRYAERAYSQLLNLQKPAPRTAAVLVGNLAYSLSLAGRLGEALPKFAESIDMFKAIGADESPTAVSVWNNWGLAALASGNPLLALGFFDRVRDISARRSPSGSPPVYTLVNLARVLNMLERTTEATREAERAIEVARANGGNASAELHARGSLIDALRRQGQPEQARAALEAIDGRLTEGIPFDSPPMLNLLRLRVLLDAQSGCLEAALEGVNTLIARVTKLGLRNSSLASAYIIRAETRLQLKESAAALLDLEQALEVVRESQGSASHSADAGLALLRRAETLFAIGDRSGASIEMESALVQLKPTLGEGHPEVSRALEIRRRLQADTHATPALSA